VAYRSSYAGLFSITVAGGMNEHLVDFMLMSNVASVKGWDDYCLPIIILKISSCWRWCNWIEGCGHEYLDNCFSICLHSWRYLFAQGEEHQLHSQCAIVTVLTLVLLTKCKKSLRSHTTWELPLYLTCMISCRLRMDNGICITWPSSNGILGGPP